MNVQLFQQIIEVLIKTHYGLELNDTPFCDEASVQLDLEKGNRPFAALNEYTEECDLVRMDLEGFWGVPPKTALTQKDEINALVIINPIEILCEQPATCMYCGSRTDFNEIENLDNDAEKQQHHRCLNVNCGYEFISEDEVRVVSVDSVQDEPVLNQQYAESIIGERTDCYDALEIHGVRDENEPGDPNGTCCEVNNENPQFFSVFAHVKADGQFGGVECVGDFGTHLLAEQYAQELALKYSWPIYDHVNPRFKQALAA